MTAWRAGAEGVRRVVAAPGIVLLIWLITLAFSVPLGLGLRRDIERQLGASLVAAPQVSGVTYDWLTEFGEQQNGGLAATFGPQVIGFAAVVDNASAWLDARPRPAMLGASLGLYALLWVFLAGGLIDRYARGRPTPAAAFFSACGAHAFRLLRLFAASGLLYAVLLTRFHTWLVDDQFDRLTGELDSERTAFLIRLGLYAMFAALLAAVNLLFDYARIRIVVEGRRSVLGGLRAAARLLRQRGGTAVRLYLLDVGLLGVVVAVYAAAAPGAGSTWIAFIVGQVYVAARIAVKLTFWASEAVWFQEQSRYTHLSIGPTTEAS